MFKRKHSILSSLVAGPENLEEHWYMIQEIREGLSERHSSEIYTIKFGDNGQYKIDLKLFYDDDFISVDIYWSNKPFYKGDFYAGTYDEFEAGCSELYDIIQGLCDNFVSSAHFLIEA